MFINSNEGIESISLRNLGFVNHLFSNRYFGIDFKEYNFIRNNFEIPETTYEKLAKLNFRVDNLVFSKQIHGDEIIAIDKVDIKKIRGTEADAIITKETNIPIVIFTTDCVPIFLADKEKKIVAAVHAGWRGTALKIASKVVKKMSDYFGSSPSNIIAAIGPSIGVCCYEVQQELGEFFLLKMSNEKFYIDLKEENKKQLIESGVLEENIHESFICTQCNHDFYSYRRDGANTGRQINIIQIKE
ncbi:MAG: peptidoglycan editing factor PgeF [Caloramator sp.]|nr:peptidoglycan editing factor PgeF [Caloramator sp.]